MMSAHRPRSTGVLGDYLVGAMLGKEQAESLDGLNAGCCVSAYVFFHAAVFVEHGLVCREQLVHVVTGVQTVVASGGVGDAAFPFPRAHPLVYVALGCIEDILNLGEELLSCPIAQTGSYESHSLLVLCPVHLVHERTRVGR